jgi:hypothetical protein
VLFDDGQTFTQEELVRAYNCAPAALVSAVSRQPLRLLSEWPGGNSPRLFHYYDALTLGLYLNFDKEFGTSGRKTLCLQLGGLLFADEFIPAAEFAERGAEIRAEFER